MILLRTCLRWSSTFSMIVLCFGPRFLLMILMYFKRCFLLGHVFCCSKNVKFILLTFILYRLHPYYFSYDTTYVI